MHIDPEHNEIRALEKVADWRGMLVLEIGCGDGRLSQRLAELGAKVFAIDPDVGIVRKARAALPQRLAKSVSFKKGNAERLGHPDNSFDAVVFAWAL